MDPISCGCRATQYSCRWLVVCNWLKMDDRQPMTDYSLNEPGSKIGGWNVRAPGALQMHLLRTEFWASS